MEKYREKIYYEYLSYIIFACSFFFLTSTFLRYKYIKSHQPEQQIITHNYNPQYNSQLTMLQDMHFEIIEASPSNPFATVQKNISAYHNLKITHPHCQIQEEGDCYKIHLQTLSPSYQTPHISQITNHKNHQVDYMIIHQDNSWSIKIDGNLYTSTDDTFQNGLKVEKISNNIIHIQYENGHTNHIIL